MSNINSAEKAYEQISEALNWLLGDGESFFQVTVMGDSHQIVLDEDAGEFFHQALQLKPREND